MKKLQEQLVDKGHLQTCASEIDGKSTKAKGKQKERLTDRELRELMGVNRDTFKRVGGRVRKR